MTPDATPKRHFHAHFQKNLLAGLLAITPLVVVWVVFDFFLGLLSQAGRPLANALTDFLDLHIPALSPWLADETVRWIIAVMVALLALYSIGAVASRVLGARLIGYFEGLIERIPFVQTVYSATKKLVTVLQQKPDGSARVVLIDFPHAGMKAVGLVMKVVKDSTTGEELAAVYVPTTPNPTSGYLEIVPVKDLVPTDMTMDQAMTMIVSGGAITPSNLSLRRRAQTGPPQGA
ncbi:MAG: DUF502 domain-containing protein [Pseudomonadota bacterium]|nr:DUF502 domain-containing protein [Pseudomonadota bacterium]